MPDSGAPSAGRTRRSDICGSEWRPRQDGPTLRCLMLRGHGGTHQAYFRDHLLEWPTTQCSGTVPEWDGGDSTPHPELGAACG